MVTLPGGAAYQPSEIIALALTIVLVPLMWQTARRVSFPGKAWFVGGFLSIVFAHTATIVEGFWLLNVFNMLEHLGYLVGGILFCVGLRRLVSSTRGGGVGEG